MDHFSCARLSPSLQQKTTAAPRSNGPDMVEWRRFSSAWEVPSSSPTAVSRLLLHRSAALWATFTLVCVPHISGWSSRVLRVRLLRRRFVLFCCFFFFFFFSFLSVEVIAKIKWQIEPSVGLVFLFASRRWAPISTLSTTRRRARVPDFSIWLLSKPQVGLGLAKYASQTSSGRRSVHVWSNCVAKMLVWCGGVVGR